MSIFVCSVCLREVVNGNVSMLTYRDNGDGLENLAVYCSDVKCQAQLHLDSNNLSKSRIQTYKIQRTCDKVTPLR